MDTQPTQASDEALSCEYDPDMWFQNFREDDEEVNDESHYLPRPDQLEKAANMPVYDADGVSRTFKSLYTGSEHIGQRQLIIFIRHFYCFVCPASSLSLCIALVAIRVPTQFCAFD